MMMMVNPDTLNLKGLRKGLTKIYSRCFVLGWNLTRRRRMVWRITLYSIYEEQTVSRRGKYETIFGSKANVGLNSLPKDALVKRSTEELETVLNEDEN